MGRNVGWSVGEEFDVLWRRAGFQLGLVQGGLYARVTVTEGVARLEFSSGADENEPMNGRACIG